MLLRDLALSAPDPALSSLFIIRLPFGDYTKDILAEKADPTFSKTPANPRFTNGSNAYYPGITDIDGMSISFYETHDLRVSKWLNDWRLMVFDKTDGSYGMPADYKKTINIGYIDPTTGKESHNADYIGMWPTDKGPFNLDYSDDSGHLMVEAQFSVDDMKWSWEK